VLALITLGEGWHNNHHYYAGSANQGFVWWEIDIAYYLIRLLARVGLVWEVRNPPPAKVLGRSGRDRDPRPPDPPWGPHRLGEVTLLRGSARVEVRSSFKSL